VCFCYDLFGLAFLIQWGSSLVAASDGVRESQGSAETIVSDVEVESGDRRTVSTDVVIDEAVAAIFETTID
jgi:hypothetical protein